MLGPELAAAKAAGWSAIALSTGTAFGPDAPGPGRAGGSGAAGGTAGPGVFPVSAVSAVLPGNCGSTSWPSRWNAGSRVPAVVIRAIVASGLTPVDCVVAPST